MSEGGSGIKKHERVADVDAARVALTCAFMMVSHSTIREERHPGRSDKGGDEA